MDISSLFENSAPNRAMPGGEELEETWRNMMYQQIDPQYMQQQAIRQGLSAFGQSITAPQKDGTHLDFLGALSQGVGGGAGVYNKVREQQDNKQLKVLGEQTKYQADDKARKTRLEELKERSRIARERLELSKSDSAALNALRNSREVRAKAEEARQQAQYEWEKEQNPVRRKLLKAQLDAAEAGVEKTKNKNKWEEEDRSGDVEYKKETRANEKEDRKLRLADEKALREHRDKMSPLEIQKADAQTKKIEQSLKESIENYKQREKAQKNREEGRYPDKFAKIEAFNKNVKDTLDSIVKTYTGAGDVVSPALYRTLQRQVESSWKQAMGIKEPEYEGATYKDPTHGEIPSPANDMEISRIKGTPRGTPTWDSVEGRIVYKFSDGTFGFNPRQ